jgi:hypothetical protein
MKLIMEGWRNYINELDLTDPTIAMMASGTSAEDTARRAKSVKDVLAGDLPPDFVELMTSLAVDSAKIGVNLAVMLLDPTGQFAGYDFDTGQVRTSYEDFKDAQEEFSRKPSLAGAGELTLASLAMIPILGKLAKGVKTAKKGLDLAKSAADAGQTIQKSQEVSAKLKKLKVPQAIKLANKIDVKIKEAYIARKELTYYQKTTASKITKLSKERLLQMAKVGDAVSHTGKVYRGTSVNSVEDLMKQIFDQNFVLRDKGSKIQEKIFQAMYKSSETKKFATIEDIGASISSSGRIEGGASFSKNMAVANDFARTRSGRFEVIFEVSTTKSNSIDVNATRKKAGLGSTKYDYEEEVLVFGDPSSGGSMKIDKIYIRPLGAGGNWKLKDHVPTNLHNS